MPMKKTAILWIIVLVCASCATKPATDEQTLYVSILPLKNIIENIVGQDLDINVLVPAGASPETFEPTPKQVVELNRARMIFNVGLIDFETSLLSRIQDRSKIVDLSQGVELIEGTCPHGAANKAANRDETSGNTHAHGVDPHIWTSPQALQIMAKNAYEAIRKVYPDSARYEANFKRLMQQLRELDTRTREKIERSGIRYFIVYHPALTYYARDYGIEQVAIEAEGKEPSARRLAGIIRNARKDGVRKIFYQNQFPASVVEIIARDIQASYIEINPLEEQVIPNIDRITDLITEP